MIFECRFIHLCKLFSVMRFILMIFHCQNLNCYILDKVIVNENNLVCLIGPLNEIQSTSESGNEGIKRNWVVEMGKKLN